MSSLISLDDAAVPVEPHIAGGMDGGLPAGARCDLLHGVADAGLPAHREVADLDVDGAAGAGAERAGVDPRRVDQHELAGADGDTAGRAGAIRRALQRARRQRNRFRRGDVDFAAGTRADGMCGDHGPVQRHPPRPDEDLPARRARVDAHAVL